MNAIFVIASLLTISGLGLSTSVEYEVGGGGDINTYGIKDIINGFIESLRDAIPEIINVPPVNIELAKNKYLTGYLNASNISVTGVKEFQANIIYVGFLPPLPNQFTLILKKVTLNLDYLTDVALFNIPLLSIFGNGTGSVTVTDLEIKGNISIKLLPMNVSINSMQLHLGAVKFGIEGLCNDEAFSDQVNGILNKNVATLINQNEKALSTTLENIINGFIQGIFNSTKPEIYENQVDGYNVYYTSEKIERDFETVVKEIKTMVN